MSLQVRVVAGNALEQDCDVLVSTGNVQLNMTGGVNGAILQRGGEQVQAELRAYLAERGETFVEPGSVVRTGPGPLKFRAILHAVAINGFYESDRGLVTRTIKTALAEAEDLGAGSVALPALATGYGPLSVEDFAVALGEALLGYPGSLAQVRVVLWRERDVTTVKETLASAFEGASDAPELV